MSNRRSSYEIPSSEQKAAFIRAVFDEAMDVSQAAHLNNIARRTAFRYANEYRANCLKAEKDDLERRFNESLNSFCQKAQIIERDLSHMDLAKKEFELARVQERQELLEDQRITLNFKERNGRIQFQGQYYRRFTNKDKLYYEVTQDDLNRSLFHVDQQLSLESSLRFSYEDPAQLHRFEPPAIKITPSKFILLSQGVIKQRLQDKVFEGGDQNQMMTTIIENAVATSARTQWLGRQWESQEERENIQVKYDISSWNSELYLAKFTLSHQLFSPGQKYNFDEVCRKKLKFQVRKDQNVVIESIQVLHICKYKVGISMQAIGSIGINKGEKLASIRGIRELTKMETHDYFEYEVEFIVPIEIETNLFYIKKEL